MATAVPETRFAHLSRRQARLVLTAVIVCSTWLVLGSLRPALPDGGPARGGVDLELYRRIIEQVHGGVGYYDAANRELRSFGYPTGSVFNWRLPVYAWLLGLMPAPGAGRLLFIALALLTLVLAHSVVARDRLLWRTVLCLILLAGCFVWCLDGDAFLSQELWAGLLITLSACAYAKGNWVIGLLAGLAALFYRELALPYCVIALLLAWREGRSKEVAAWLGGFALFGVFYFYHAGEVMHRITPGDRLPASWVQFGGAGFLIASCQMNRFLFSAPGWVSAIYLVVSCLGLASQRSPLAARLGLTVAAYLAAFTVVGQPFNDYWGLLYVPLLPFGLVWGPAALADLWSRAFESRGCKAHLALKA
jgi:hypothetical protein